MTAQEAIKIAKLEVKVDDISTNIVEVKNDIRDIKGSIEKLDGKYITRLEALAVSAAVSFILILVGLYLSGRS